MLAPLQQLVFINLIGNEVEKMEKYMKFIYLEDPKSRKKQTVSHSGATHCITLAHKIYDEA